MGQITENMRRITEKAHAGQFRKWSNPPQPYIVHPIRVAEKVTTLRGVDDIDIAAAYGHDILEDCGEQWASVIEKECGVEVLALVRELTFETEKPEWQGRPRAEKNAVREKHMRAMSDRAKRIKMVDRWDNLLDMKNAPYRLIRKTVDESYILLEICGPADPEMAKELTQQMYHNPNKLRGSFTFFYLFDYVFQNPTVENFMLFNPIYQNDKTGMAVFSPIQDVIKSADSSPKGKNPFYKVKNIPNKGKSKNPFYDEKWNW